MEQLDAVAVVEQAYDLDASDQTWLEQLVAAAAKGLGRGCGMFGTMYGAGGLSDGRALTFPGADIYAEVSAQLGAEGASAAVEQAFTRATTVSSMRAILRTLGKHELARWDRVAGPRGICDVIGVLAHDAEGNAVNIGAPSPRRERVSADERKHWTRIAAHIGAVLRVRGRIRQLDSTVEAVLSRTGKVEHLAPDLRGDAASATALQQGARGMVAARGRLRRDPDQALEAWPSMVAARWTLVERIERDGKHLVEARANIPRRLAFAALSPLERTCVELVRRGHANKEIAYALGVSVGTISSALASAMRKIGVRTRVGLIVLGDAPELADVERVLGPAATPAEIAVAALAAAGLSNAQIAEQRAVAPRTVANQLARLFERVGVGSRTELAALIQTARSRR